MSDSNEMVVIQVALCSNEADRYFADDFWLYLISWVIRVGHEAPDILSAHFTYI